MEKLENKLDCGVLDTQTDMKYCIRSQDLTKDIICYYASFNKDKVFNSNRCMYRDTKLYIE